MRRIALLLAGLTLWGLAAGCDAEADPARVRARLPLDLEEDQGAVGTYPAELAPVEATASFSSKIVTKEAVEATKKSYLKYCPLIEFSVHDATYSPRWPGATLSYRPGNKPLPKAQIDLFRKAVEQINATVGFKIFTMLADGASADIPVSDSTEFPNHSVLGETTARVVSRTSETAFILDFSEEMRLRPGLSNSLFYKVALHELGHAAGLEHNPDPNTLMNRGTGLRTPSEFAQTEKESLRLLYALPDTALKRPRGTQAIGAAPLIGWTLD